MAKLTKDQTRRLEGVLHDIRRALVYIQSPRTVVCSADTHATTTLHYTCPGKPGALYPVNKEYGSDLCGLEAAADELAMFLADGGSAPKPDQVFCV